MQVSGFRIYFLEPGYFFSKILSDFRKKIVALQLFNQALAIAGKSTISFAENDIYQLVSLGWTVAASVIAWWKNNSFTCAACEADAWMKAKLEEKKSDTTKEK